MNEQTMLYEEPVRPEDLALRALAEKIIPVWPRYITRGQLAELYGGGDVGDRRGRKDIERMRRAGVVIVNKGDGKGYYRPADDDVESVLAQKRTTYSRAMSLLLQVKAQREWLRDRGVEV